MNLLIFLLGLLMTGCLQTRGQLAKGGATLESQNAQMDNRFYEIDKDFRELYGKIENIENQVNQMAQNTSKSSDEDPTEDSETLVQLKSRVATLEEALLALDKKISNKSAKVLNPKIGGSFAVFIQGDRLYRQGKYGKAIENFQKYRTTYPKGKMYPLATMRIAESFDKLNMADEAKPFYREVVEKYPVSKVAQRASEKLKIMQ